MNKEILDPCCGSKMFYFDKENKNVLFGDCRQENITLYNGRKLNVNPEQILDVTHLPFEDNTFNLVVLDPPHLIRAGEKSYMAQKYGKLPKNWQSFIHDAFNECMRVLKCGHVLIFKWNEYQIPVFQIIDTIGVRPLFGNRCGKASKTHWLVFYKGLISNETHNQI